jgi:coenzyme F420-reducing hydrogenase delta subunit
MQDLLEFVGIEGERLNLVWVSAAQGPRFAEEITKFTEKIRALGPLNWNDQWTVANSELRAASASE